MYKDENNSARQPTMSPSAELQQADAFDQAGRHDQAINTLAVAVKKKDVEAMTRLGRRLLVGDRAPHLPKDGVSFIKEAAGLGGGEAAATLAVLQAMGVHMEQSWHDAAECLLAAALCGWDPARAQLRVLAEDRALAARAENPGTEPGIWRRLVEDIDFGFWLEPPAGTTLNEAPLIRSFPGFTPPPVCDWLIQRAAGRLSRAKVYDGLNGTTRIDGTRTNSACNFGLLESDLVTALLQTRMARCAAVPLRHLEPAAVLHYAPGEEITEHYDFVDPQLPNYEQVIARKGQRIVTFLVYLNDEYRGGETHFPRLDIGYKGSRGDGLFFVNALPDGAADTRTAHTGSPPADGEKWIVSQFIRNRPTF